MRHLSVCKMRICFSAKSTPPLGSVRFSCNQHWSAEACPDLSLLQRTASQGSSHEQHSAVDRQELKEWRSVRNVSKIVKSMVVTLKMNHDWSKYIPDTFF